MNSLANKYYLKVRNIQERNVNKIENENVFEFTNKRKLGRSEVDLIQIMYNFMKDIITKENVHTKPPVKVEVKKEEKKEEHKEPIHHADTEKSIKSEHAKEEVKQ